jgi:glycine cleavage system H protein
VSLAPDYVEAVVGYRAWHVGDDGLLRPWTFTALPWAPGINRAVCARDARHVPPVADCMCGLYALSDVADRRLDFRADQAVGAVAAWGDLEVHRTGFRAEQACIVALALPDRAGVDQRDRLERAAARYGVPLVPAAGLSAEALRHGAPLPDDLWAPAWPAPRRAPAGPGRLPAVDPQEFGGAARGIALDAHLWVETALGSIVVGLTRALADGLGKGVRLTLPEPGAALEAGDRAATVSAGGSAVGVWAPVGGSVLAVNPRLAADPGLLARDPEGAGWLLRLAPRDWARDAPAVTWGAAADRHYAACLARGAARGDAFADVRLERLHALPPVRSAADVLAFLRAERDAPRFADAGAVAGELAARLRAALAADPRLRAHLGRLGMVVRFALHDPDAGLVLDLRAGDARVDVDAGPDAPPADLELRCAADDAYRWFTGTLDAAGALRCGDLRSSSGPGPTLRALAVLKHLRVPAWDRAPSWAR